MTVNLERSSFEPEPPDISYLRHTSGMAAGGAEVQREILAEEAAGRDFKAFAPVFVPGLLQTRAYASTRLMEAFSLLGLPLGDVDDTVELRMARGLLLDDAERRFHFVLAEYALYGGAAAAPVMLGQLRRVADIVRRPNVRLGVLPARSTMRVSHPMSHVNIIDNTSVSVETLAVTYRISASPELAAYSRVFDAVAAAAVYGPRAWALIEDALQWWATAGGDL